MDQKGNNLRENCKIKYLHPRLAHVPCTSSIHCFVKIGGGSIPISHFWGVNEVKTEYWGFHNYFYVYVSLLRCKPAGHREHVFFAFFCLCIETYSLIYNNNTKIYWIKNFFKGTSTRIAKWLEFLMWSLWEALHLLL